MDGNPDLSKLFGPPEDEDPKHRIDMKDENENIIDRALHLLREAWSVLRGIYGGLEQFNVGHICDSKGFEDICDSKEFEDPFVIGQAQNNILEAVRSVRQAIDGLDAALEERRKKGEENPENGHKQGDKSGDYL